MGSIHKFIGGGNTYNWEAQRIVVYSESQGAKNASMKWIIGPAENAPHFAIRYVEIQRGGYSSLESHEHDHGVVVLKGKGIVVLNETETEISFGDAIYIPPNEIHQFKNTGDETLGFFCIIPNKELLVELKSLRLAHASDI